MSRLTMVVLWIVVLISSGFNTDVHGGAPSRHYCSAHAHAFSLACWPSCKINASMQKNGAARRAGHGDTRIRPADGGDVVKGVQHVMLRRQNMSFLRAAACRPDASTARLNSRINRQDVLARLTSESSLQLLSQPQIRNEGIVRRMWYTGEKHTT